MPWSKVIALQVTMVLVAVGYIVIKHFGG